MATACFYGRHVISLARALFFNSLVNAQMIVALNRGGHANPCFAGDTISAWSEVLDIAQSRVPGIGAIRLRLVAQKTKRDRGRCAGKTNATFLIFFLIRIIGLDTFVTRVKATRITLLALLVLFCGRVTPSFWPVKRGEDHRLRRLHVY